VIVRVTPGRFIVLALGLVVGCGGSASPPSEGDASNQDITQDAGETVETGETEDAAGPAGDTAPLQCDPGFRLEGEVCVDIDECATDHGGCGDPLRWECVDQPGSEPLCVDVDECATDHGGCGDPAHWRCQNHEGAEPTCTFDPAADWMALTDGVYLLHSGGSVPSALVVHAEQAFPVVVDADGRVVVAAARHGAGRLLHFGHESHLGGALSGQGDTAALVQNAIGWMADGGAAPTVGVQAGYDDLVAFLEEQGVVATIAGLESLASVDVYVGDTYADRTDADIEALQAFVAAGGGLITGGHAWWWAQDTDQGLEAHTGNRLLAPMGVTLTGLTGASGEKVVGGAPKGDLYHHHQALAHAAAHCLGEASLTEDEQSRALATVRLALEALEASYAAYYDHARALRAAAGPVMPTAEVPMAPQATPMCWLMVELDHALAQGLPPAEVQAHPCVEDFPYAVAADAERVSQALVIDASYAGRPWQYVASGAGEPVWRSTGLYAPAGEVVTVTVDGHALASRHGQALPGPASVLSHRRDGRGGGERLWRDDLYPGARGRGPGEPRRGHRRGGACAALRARRDRSGRLAGHHPAPSGALGGDRERPGDLPRALDRCGRHRRPERHHVLLDRRDGRHGGPRRLPACAREARALRPGPTDQRGLVSLGLPRHGPRHGA
jgi:hypothetical protein